MMSLLRPITPAFLSSHTLSPSFTFSLSTLRFFSAMPPVAMIISPLCRSRRQQSLGTMLAFTSDERGGRLENERFKATSASLKPSLRAAT